MKIILKYRIRIELMENCDIKMDLEKIDKTNTLIIKYSKTDNVLTDICSIIDPARDYAF